MQVAYAIGVAHPVSVLVETFGTGKICRRKGSRRPSLTSSICGPAAIIHHLDLRRPIYKQTAAYGHFGRPDLDLPWERLDRVDALREATRFRGEVVSLRG